MRAKEKVGKERVRGNRKRIVRIRSRAKEKLETGGFRILIRSSWKKQIRACEKGEKCVSDVCKNVEITGGSRSKEVVDEDVRGVDIRGRRILGRAKKEFEKRLVRIVVVATKSVRVGDTRLPWL